MLTLSDLHCRIVLCQSFLQLDAHRSCANQQVLEVRQLVVLTLRTFNHHRRQWSNSQQVLDLLIQQHSDDDDDDDEDVIIIVVIIWRFNMDD